MTTTRAGAWETTDELGLAHLFPTTPAWPSSQQCHTACGITVPSNIERLDGRGKHHCGICAEGW